LGSKESGIRKEEEQEPVHAQYKRKALEVSDYRCGFSPIMLPVSSDPSESAERAKEALVQGFCPITYFVLTIPPHKKTKEVAVC